MINPDFRKDFEKLLMDNTISGDMYGGVIPEAADLYDQLTNLTKQNIPAKLYRYRTCTEYNFQSLKEDYIYAVLPQNFNDPFDSLRFCNKEALLGKFKTALYFQWMRMSSEDKICNFIFNNNKKSPKGCTKNKNTKGVFQSENEIETIQKLNNAYNSGCTNAEFIDIIQSDIDETMSYMEDYIDHYVNISHDSECKIACLTEKNDNMLMWSHYADQHKGFVLEYDLKEMVYPTEKKESETYENAVIPAILFPVIYSDKRFDATTISEYFILNKFADMKGMEKHVTVLPDVFYIFKTHLIKAKCWEYEEEWRFLSLGLYDDDKVKIRIKPTAIYYGRDISSTNRDILSSMAKEKKIPEYQSIIEYDCAENKIKFERL